MRWRTASVKDRVDSDACEGISRFVGPGQIASALDPEPKVILPTAAMQESTKGSSKRSRAQDTRLIRVRLAELPSAGQTTVVRTVRSGDPMPSMPGGYDEDMSGKPSPTVELPDHEAVHLECPGTWESRHEGEPGRAPLRRNVRSSMRWFRK